MKILVFSDSHGKGNRMHTITERNDPDVILFLGDGLRDFYSLSEKYGGRAMLVAVKGNCDLLDGAPEERIIELDGFKILMLHGHKKSVKNGTCELEDYAERLGVDLVLYGHTHARDIRIIERRKPFYIFNPGSIGAASYLSPSFGYIETVNGQLMINCADYKE